MNRIALVEDHEPLAALVRQALRSAGIEVDVFDALEPAWRALGEIDYGAVVVDRGLPDGDGLSLVKRLRQAGNATPCLMLTARDALHDRVDGLESGADDYLTKPFPMEELVARTRALMRRPKVLRHVEPQYGDIQVRPADGTMRCADRSIALASAELQIALCLVQRGGQPVRRGMLEAAAWGLSDAVTPNAFDVALHRLRRKLEAVGSTLQISNLRSHGYVLR
jgi:DNA-binding response OmpR family regulator